MIKTVFRQNKENLEFTGLDFKAFFILMSSIDFIYIYGKNSAGSMNKDEWQIFMKDKMVRPDILDNIDDCYIDRAEEDEKLPHTSHWGR